VDFEFGTGVLKVTPRTTKADFDIYNRIVAKGLADEMMNWRNDAIEVIAADGKMTGEAGQGLAGKDRFVARKEQSNCYGRWTRWLKKSRTRTTSASASGRMCPSNPV